MKHDSSFLKCSTNLLIPPSTSTFVHALTTCYSKNIKVKCVECFGCSTYFDSNRSLTVLPNLLNASIIVHYANLQYSSHALGTTMQINILIVEMHFKINNKPNMSQALRFYLE